MCKEVINILLTKKVKLKWCSRTKYYYIDRGYKFTKIGDLFTANIDDVTHGSEVIVMVKCDYCGKTFETKYSSYIKSTKTGKNACVQCSSLKVKDTCMKKYGVENVSQSDIVQEIKSKNNLKKYGVTNPSKLQFVKDKVIQTNIKRYGVEYPMKTKEFQNRVRKTSMEKYGVEHHTKSEVVKNKQRQTMLRKYGCMNPTQNKEILHKLITSRYIHGNFTCSKQQYQLYKLIGGKLNYPFRNFIIDVAYPSEKIAIEWDGSGHDLSVRLGKITRENFIRNENFRKISLFQEDWKIIRFITKKDIFPDNMKSIFDYCYQYIKNGGHHIQVFIDNELIKTKKQTIKFDEIFALND